MRLLSELRARSSRLSLFAGLLLVACLQPVAAFAQQNLSMTMSGPASTPAYQQFAYTLTITNTGSSDFGFFDIVDVLPAGATFVKSSGFPRNCFASGQTVDCNGSFVGVSVPVGSPLVVTITVAANGAASCAALTNSATLTVNDGSGTTLSPSPVTTTLTGCNPATTTTVTPPASVVAGASAWIGASVSAASGATAAGTVTINDTTDGLSCTYVLGSIPAGCAISIMSAGTKQLTATYSGGYGLLGSTSAATNLVVAQGYASLQPARLLDTRSGGTTVDHLFEGVGSVPPNGQLSLSVLNRGGVPASNVDAVVLNLAAVNPTAASFATVWPTGANRPLAANLNYVAGLTIPNLVIGKVGTNGSVSIYNSTGSADFVADVQGYFPTGSGFTPLNPARLLDTRPGYATIDGTFAGTGSVAPATELDLTVAGRGGVPASGAGAVALNLTVTNTTANGFITAWPAGTSRPLASNLNFTANQTVPNLVIAQVGVNGKVALFNSAGSTHLIADVAGWFPSASNLQYVAPARLLDTRAGRSTIDGSFAGTGAIAAKKSLDLAVTNRAGVPSSGVGSVILNVTAVSPTAASYLTVWPAGQSRPLAANLNFTAGVTISNLVIAKVGANGQVSIFNNQGSADVVVDIVGWFPG